MLWYTCAVSSIVVSGVCCIILSFFHKPLQRYHNFAKSKCNSSLASDATVSMIDTNNNIIII